MSERADRGVETKILDVEALTFQYDAHAVVDLERLQLGAKKSLAIIGPSGCGKTTLLHLLAGLLKPASGEIRILGRDITNMGGTELDRFRGQHMGMVFQRLYLLPALTVRENIHLAHRLARKPRASAWTDALLQRLELDKLADRKPRDLSQGQAQRVAIARALVHGPALVLADEPTSALDDDRAQQALSLLKETTAALNASLIVVTHDSRIRGQLDQEFAMSPLS